MYELPIPRIKEGEKYFTEILIRSAKLICTSSNFENLADMIGIKEGIEDEEVRQHLKNQIDAYIAMIYGVNRDELLYILSTFKSPKHKEEIEKISQGIIEQFDILEAKGELKCPT
jgi:hypothetical protein